MRQNKNFCESVTGAIIGQAIAYEAANHAINAIIRDLDSLLHHEEPSIRCEEVMWTLPARKEGR